MRVSKRTQPAKEPYTNQFPLPSGFMVLPRQMYAKGTHIRSNKTDALFVVHSLGKLINAQGAMETAVFYHPHNPLDSQLLTAQTLLSVVSDYKVNQSSFEIWVGRYAANGAEFPAHKLGEVIAYCFAEACHIYFQEKGKLEVLDLEGSYPTMIGYSTLYQSEAQARGGHYE